MTEATNTTPRTARLFTFRVEFKDGTTMTRDAVGLSEKSAKYVAWEGMSAAQRAAVFDMEAIDEAAV